MKILKVVGFLFFLLFLFGSFVTGLRSCGKEDKDPTVPPTTETPTDPSTYTITYRAVQDGAETDIDESFFKSDGNYPPTYTEGETVHISDLVAVIDVGAYEDRTFEGWYLDGACTQAFDGVIDSEGTNDLTLYAKISVGYWTKAY